MALLKRIVGRQVLQAIGQLFDPRRRPLIILVKSAVGGHEVAELIFLELADLQIGEYLINALDHHGLMDRDLEEVADDLSFHMQSIVEMPDVERILKVIQELEPIGIGAKSVQECLLIQLNRGKFTAPEARPALRLIRNHYNDLMHRQFEKIQHALNIDEEELRHVLTFIGTLKFYPVCENASSFEPKSTIIPDFIITRFGDNIQVHLQSVRSNSVFVNQSLYDQLSTQTSPRDRGAAQYVKSKLQSAQWFVNAVKQREETMMRIMQCIVQIQHDYFLEGDIRLLKPMVLRIVAEKSGLDISTVSRITSNKYADTHFGIIYLKDLFSEGIADKKGEVISNKVIQSVIEEAISGEDKRHPYTDQQLVLVFLTIIGNVIITVFLPILIILYLLFIRLIIALVKLLFSSHLQKRILLHLVLHALLQLKGIQKV